jgi:DNA-binding transcriptional ArsR family regulator
MCDKSMNLGCLRYHRNMEENDVVRSLSALAQPVRLRLFRALVVAGPLGLTPGVLAEELGVPAATLSFHLKELTYAGLISQERSGRYLIYRASFERMNGLLAYLTDHCCRGSACLDVAGPACTAV